MTFFSFIEKLQNKPRQKRKIIALVVTFVCFSFVFLVWLTTFQLDLDSVNDKETPTALSPLNSVKRITTRFVDDLKEVLGQTKNFSSENVNSAIKKEVSSPSIQATTTDVISPKSPEQFLDENSSIIPEATTTINIGTTSKNTSFYENAGL